MSVSTVAGSGSVSRRSSGVIEGIERLIRRLLRMKDKYPPRTVSVVVGFRAAYAIWVHENVEMKWRGKPRRSGIGVYWGPSGQAKYLEAPAREFAADIGAAIADGTKRTGDFVKGLLAGGYLLLRLAQERVPVEYSNLRSSGYVELEES